MNTFDAIYERRSVKHFDPHYRISDEVRDKLLDAAIQAPSSFNLQHWRFANIISPQLRQEIKALGFNQAQFTDASLLIATAADVNAWSGDVSRYWQNAPEEVRTVLTSMIGPFYEGSEQLQRDEAQRSIGMATQTLMLAAKAQGLDSCPMIGFDIEAVSKLLNLPEHYVIGPFIAIGKKTQSPWPKPGQLTLDEVVKENTF